MSENEEITISFSEILVALKKRWIAIVLIILLSTILAVVVSFFVLKPTYEASTKLFIGKEENIQESYDNNDVQMYQRLIKTYSEAIRTKDLMERAISKAQLDIKPETALSSITVVPIADTQIIQIKYKGGNSEEVANLLKAISSEFIETAKELVPNGEVKIIEAVEIPANPVSPNKGMIIVMGFILGMFISLALVFILEYLDNTYKNKENLENELNLPVLGVIPKEEQ